MPNVEKVVKPPRTPVINNISEVFDTSPFSGNINPMTSAPIKLTDRIPHGKLAVIFLDRYELIPYLATAPINPPISTANISIIPVPHLFEKIEIPNKPKMIPRISIALIYKLDCHTDVSSNRIDSAVKVDIVVKPPHKPVPNKRGTG